jgi:hypothetical protein
VTASVAYPAVLPVRAQTVLFLSGLLDHERRRCGTRAGRRAVTCHNAAVMVLRWFLDGTRVAQLARDNAISVATAYRYLHDGIDGRRWVVGSVDVLGRCGVGGQIAWASSVDAVATRAAGGVSMASSWCLWRGFCMKACPAVTVWAVLSVRSARIGLDRCLSRL